MANKTGRYSWIVLIMLLIMGGMVGTWIKEPLIRAWPTLNFLAKSQSIGITPTTLDLNVFVVTFGFSLQINFFSILGFILAYYIYRKI